MSELNEEELNNLCNLCRIACTDEEKKSLLVDMKKILAHIDQLQELDTSDVEPCNHVLAGVYNTMRDDEIGETLSTKTFLENSPSHVGGMIRVPPVIKK